MFVFTLLLAVSIIVFLVESVLKYNWASFYFLRGVAILTRRGSNVSIGAAGLDVVTLEQLALREEFTPIVYHQFSHNVYGFREGLLPGFVTKPYHPFMHGRLEIQPNGEFVLSGLMDWYPPFFIVAVIGLLFHMAPLGIALLFVVFGIVIFIINYRRQAFRYEQIAEAFKEYGIET